MAKTVHIDVLDGALNIIKNNCDKMTVCAGQPTTYTQANVSNSLGEVAMVSGDFTVGVGDVSGRKVRVASKSGVSVATGGTANHVALLDTANSKLLYVTTCTDQVLTGGNTITFPFWDIEIADPT